MVKIMEIKQPRASKEGKTYWHKLGVKFIFDDGNESIKLDSLPLPNDKGEVWLNVFEPRPRDEAGATGTWDKPNDTATTDDTEKPEEIPF